GPPEGDLPNAPATDSDSLSPLQWDMRQIHTPEAHAITGGSPAVLVGDIDTGIDFNHPDLKQNIDVADSVNCTSGAPVPGLAAQDDNGHGTHTAGTIAAASNGFGIVGVAPNVHIAAIKAGDAAGFFFPQAVICSFYWAATHHVDVTNNSYFADPFLFNCHNDPVQQAIWAAESRAILYAEQNGVTVVAAAGNESEDLAHPTTDATSPDNGTPITRSVTNACVVIPVGARDLERPERADGRLLLPAGDVDGLAARRRGGRADSQPVRKPQLAAEREDAARSGQGLPRPDGRSAAVPDVPPADVRELLRRRHRERAVLRLPGWPGLQLVVRERPGERAQRGHAQPITTRESDRGE